MAVRQWFEKRPGVYVVHCYDCNRSMEIKQGEDCNIEVGEKGKVLGVLCDQCKSRLDSTKTNA